MQQDHQDLPDDPATGRPLHGSRLELAVSRLPLLGWLFVAVSLIVAAHHVNSFEVSPLRQIPWRIAYGVEAVAVTLLPAALLYRAPDALRTHGMLFLGLIALAGARVADLSGIALTITEPAFDGVILDPGLRIRPGPLLGLAGALLVGLGLLRLRRAGAGPSRPFLLAAIAGLYVGLSVLEIGMVATVNGSWPIISPYDLTVNFMRLAATAFAVWVAVNAWLDRAVPRLFWGFLAAALPLYVIEAAAELASGLFVTSQRSGGIHVPGVTVMALAAAISAVLALIAYARMTPIEQDA